MRWVQGWAWGRGSSQQSPEQSVGFALSSRPWAHSALPGPKPTASTPCGARKHDRAGVLAYLCRCPLSKLLLNFPCLLSYPLSCQ